ncbi:MAG: Uma2 family endonuclease [Desulfobacteraceae bacterium]|nr:Uma2 family endonuclease [Desulfobacteraceae bacterium]
MEALRSPSYRIPEQHIPAAILIKGEVSENGRFVSEKEYWNHYYRHPDFSYEWNNGYLEEKPMTDLRGSLIYQWFLDILRRYFSICPIGRIVNLEIGFRLELPFGASVRKPDLAILRDDNPVMMHLNDFSYKGTFDLCIESLSYSSPKEVRRDTIEKKKEYESVGVKEYYILDARQTETAFYRLDEKGKYRKIVAKNQDIIESDVLPGFRFRISDLYRQPSLEEIAEDEVYQHYVLPFYRDVRRKIGQVESELLIERQKSERLVAKLRELGIDPTEV